MESKLLHRRIQLKGKYMDVIERWVQSLDFGGRRLFTVNDQLRELTTSIAKLHRDYIDIDTARSLLYDECDSFRRSKGLIGGEMLQDTPELRGELVARIKQLIESYPRTYKLRIELPSFPAYGVSTIPLSDEVRVVIEAPPTLAVGLQVLFDASRQAPPIPYLEIDVDGYGDESVDSPAVAAALSVAKQCLFVFESQKILEATYYPSKEADAHLIDELTGISLFVGIPQALARHLAKLIPNERALTAIDPGPTILGIRREATTAEEKLLALTDAFDPVARYLQAQNHPDFQPLAAAIEWYQDSIHSEDQTFSYLAVCIGFEAILGSDDHMPEMSMRLADRYAFRMGRNRANRAELFDAYSAMLNLRGKLVHAKTARLRSSEDRSRLRAAQRMLRELITKELQDLYKAQRFAEEQPMSS